MRDRAELAEAVRAMHAVTARLVGLIGAAIAGDREGRGVHTVEQWVSGLCGVAPARAGRLVAIARRLPELPATAAAFEAGELSEDQVALLCAHECGDGEGVEMARARTVAELRRGLADKRPRQQKGPERRRVGFGHDERGGWRLWAELPADEGAAVERALVAARTPKGDWADALLTMAERSMNGGRSRAAKPMVLLHVRMDEDEATGHLHLGPAVPDRLRRYMSCDSWIRLLFESQGKAVSVGRQMYTVPWRTRIVVEERDRGCRVPGCERTKWLQIHHIVHWEDGGPTDTWNLVALCHGHHRLHHLGRLRIEGNADEPDGLVFADETGRPLARGPTPLLAAA